MKGALALIAVLLLAGCGQASVPSAGQSSAPGDPFVGTWRVNAGDRVRWVIGARPAGRYTVTQGVPGDIEYRKLGLFTRHGDQLSGRVLTSTDVMSTFLLRSGNAPGQLLLTFSATNLSTLVQMTLTKLSDSTAKPTPVP
jgi:hypothetical protein